MPQTSDSGKMKGAFLFHYLRRVGPVIITFIAVFIAQICQSSPI